MMRVLLVDDDPDTHDFIITYLAAAGIDVLSAYTGPEGIHGVQDQRPDLVILDIELPFMDGWDVCRRIRMISDVPILIISAVAQGEQDIIRGLNIGADDYLLKPIHLDILKAHINALFRRTITYRHKNSQHGYLDAHLTVDLRQNGVYVQGKHFPLSYLEQQLLELLVSNANATVPNLEIVEVLWSESVDDSYLRYVRIYVKRLREIIEPDPHNPVYIMTDYGQGYRFCSR
jgi:DNA-binding response OmpR family regulator